MAMQNFTYKAVDEHGRMLRGELVAGNESDLDSRLVQIGLQLVTCNKARGVKRVGRKKTPRRELINFCFHLEQAHRAGLSILEALHDLRDSTDDEGFRNVLAALALAIESGKQLSEAMDEFPATFDTVFVALVKAGETSGELSQVLAKMVETLKWQDELIAQTKKIMLYPAFVGTVVLAVMMFLMVYVVPEMMSFLETMQQEMPIYTKALIATSNFFVSYWYLVPTVPIVTFFLLSFLLRTQPPVRYAFDSFKLKVWLIGPILEKIIMSRFATYFQIMYASGITIMDALATSRNLAGNVVIRDGLATVSQRVEDGQSLSESVASVGLFPSLVTRMIRMGEDIGQLEDALTNVTYFYNREVEESVDRLQSMIEPAMTVVLGLLLGWVMLSVLSPIYDTIATLGA